MNTAIYDQIKDIVINGLTTKGLSWFKPWTATDGCNSGCEWRPIKWATGKTYNGINVFLLTAKANAMGWQHNQWLTFNQCSAAGGKLEKGSKATDAYFWEIGVWNPATKKKYRTLQQALDAGEDEKDLKKYIILKVHKVFNIEQTTLSPRVMKVVEKPAKKVFNPIDAAEAIVAGYQGKPSIAHGGNGAYYSPSLDHVQMPEREAFIDADSYYHVLFHELVHSTGHQSRLKREGVCKGGVRFGDATYSQEELVAESAAMMLSGIAGTSPHIDNSVAYIQGWVKGVKETPATAVVSALTQAAKAVDYIIGE